MNFVKFLKTLFLQNTSGGCFYQYRFSFINSVKSVSDNFESFFDNVKKYILLYGDSRFDTSKK